MDLQIVSSVKSDNPVPSRNWLSAFGWVRRSRIRHGQGRSRTWPVYGALCAIRKPVGRVRKGFAG